MQIRIRITTLECFLGTEFEGVLACESSPVDIYAFVANGTREIRMNERPPKTHSQNHTHLILYSR